MCALTISAQFNIWKIPLQKKKETWAGETEYYPSYCIVTVLPMSANLRSSKIKKLCLSAIFSSNME